MSEQEKQESQKTVVAFVAGLLIGGLLVWIFSSSPNDAMAPDTSDDAANIEETTDSVMTSDDEVKSDDVETPDTTPELITGEGKVVLGEQPAGSVVSFESVTFPVDEGWVAIRTYNDDKLGSILGASRFSKEQGLVPETVQLLAPTTAGRKYAVVFFSENGDRTFNLANDAQIEGVFSAFTAK